MEHIPNPNPRECRVQVYVVRRSSCRCPDVGYVSSSRQSSRIGFPEIGFFLNCMLGLCVCRFLYELGLGL